MLPDSVCLGEELPELIFVEFFKPLNSAFDSIYYLPIKPEESHNSEESVLVFVFREVCIVARRACDGPLHILTKRLEPNSISIDIHVQCNVLRLLSLG